MSPKIVVTLKSHLVFGDDLEDAGGVLSTMEFPLSDLVSRSAANLFESAVDLLGVNIIIMNSSCVQLTELIYIFILTKVCIWI